MINPPGALKGILLLLILKEKSHHVATIQQHNGTNIGRDSSPVAPTELSRDSTSYACRKKLFT